MAFSRIQHGGGAVVTTLVSDITSSATVATLTDSTGWPDGSIGPFYAVFDPDLPSEEKVLVTSRSGNVLSGIARNVDGTSASAHVGGAQVAHIFTANEA